MTWILLGLAIVAVATIVIYNSLARLRVQADSAWSDSARSRAMQVSGPAARGEAEGTLTQALKSLFALAESYPQLRAVESFTQLQTTLADIEEAVQNARRYYNAVVRDLNTRIVQFPSNIVAGMFGFRQREFFELGSAAEREVPKVSFGGGV
jgi:LemA protein